MSRFIILFFSALTIGGSYYLTYQGDTLQKVVTTQKKSARSSSTHYSSRRGSYSGGYSYGK